MSACTLLLQQSAQPMISRMGDVIVDMGGTAVFTCRVCGKPRPNVQWTGPSRTAIANTNRTWCEYSDDGVAQLQVSGRRCWNVACIIVFSRYAVN